MKTSGGLLFSVKYHNGAEEMKIL